MTFRTFLIAINFMLVVGICAAQENYKQGYIINSKGDTLRGEIDYRDWVAPPDRVSFRDGSGSITSIAPLEIKGFGIRSDHYESGVVEREVSPYLDEELDENKDFKIRLDTVFLQVLVSGDKNLYLFKELITPPQFYIKNGGRYELLRYKRFVQEKNKVKEVFENNQFRYQLISYLSDCSKLRNELIELKYQTKGLKKIFDKYYSCSKKEISFRRKETVTHHLGVLGGVSSSTLDFASSLPYFTDSKLYLTRGTFETSISPAAGVSWEIIFPGNQGRWSMYNEWIFASFNSIGKYETQGTSGDYQTNSMNIGYTVRKLNLMARYNYRLKNGRLFVTAGVLSGHLNITKNDWEQQFSQSGTVGQKSGDAFISKNGLSGFTIGPGVEIGRFNVTVRYENSHTPSGDVNHTSKTNTIYALLGFRVFRLAKY